MMVLNISRKMRERRQQLGLSQKALFEKSGVFQPIISSIEQGKVCNQDTAERLAAALGCTFEDLTSELVSATASTVMERQGTRAGEPYGPEFSVDARQVDVPPIYSRVGVECQRTAGDLLADRWDRIRVYMEQPCVPEDMEAVKGSLIDNTIRTVEEAMRRIAITANQEPIPDLKISR